MKETPDQEPKQQPEKTPIDITVRYKYVEGPMPKDQIQVLVKFLSEQTLDHEEEKE